MQKHFSRDFIITFVFFLSLLFINSRYIYAGTLTEEAKSYREKGYEAQERGDIDSAISWYQKAAALNQKYAAPHNDLGILYEAKGWLDRAETEYQKALAIDSNYEEAHTNLALLYERRGELEKAAFHWMRRYKLGRPGEAWTNEARKRLEKLGLLGKRQKGQRAKPSSEQKRAKKKSVVKKKSTKGWTRLRARPKENVVQKKTRKKIQKKAVSSRIKKSPEIEIKRRPGKKASEWTRLGGAPKKKRKITKARRSTLDRELQESLRLAEERLRKEKAKKGNLNKKEEKYRQKMSDTGARRYYTKAKNYSEKGEYTRALDAIRIAKRDYPSDSDLLELEQSIKDKMKEERITDHYNEGVLRYHQKDFSGARKEFEAILNILPE